MTIGHWVSAGSSSQPGESGKREPGLVSEQTADFSFEGKESVQRDGPNNLPKAHLIHWSASSGAAESIFQSIVIMDVPSQETSNQWWGQSPLGADNTTDSLLTMRGVRSAWLHCKNAKANLTSPLRSSGVQMKWIEASQRNPRVTSAWRVVFRPNSSWPHHWLLPNE